MTIDSINVRIDNIEHEITRLRDQNLEITEGLTQLASTLEMITEMVKKLNTYVVEGNGKPSVIVQLAELKSELRHMQRSESAEGGRASARWRAVAAGLTIAGLVLGAVFKLVM